VLPARLTRFALAEPVHRDLAALSAEISRGAATLFAVWRRFFSP
jgi:hypothetical protein